MFKGICEPVLAEMGRRDYFYCDKNFARFSLVKLEGYQLFSENLAKTYPGYYLDSKGHILPSTDHLVNLDELLALLRSKDITRYEKVKDKFFGPTGRYTTQNACEQMSVSFSTYPRSGNSMMRKYFESVTGIATGEEMGVKNTPHISL